MNFDNFIVDPKKNPTAIITRNNKLVYDKGNVLPTKTSNSVKVLEVIKPVSNTALVKPKTPIMTVSKTSTKEEPLKGIKTPVKDVQLGTPPSGEINLPSTSDKVKDMINEGLKSLNPMVKQQAEKVLKEEVAKEIKNPTEPTIVQSSSVSNSKNILYIGGGVLVIVLLISILKK